MEDLFYEIRDKWKNREDDFITGYNEYMDDTDAFGLFGVDAKHSQEAVKNDRLSS